MTTFTPSRRYESLSVAQKLGVMEKLYWLTDPAGEYFLLGKQDRMRDARLRLIALRHNVPVRQWTVPHGD